MRKLFVLCTVLLLAANVNGQGKTISGTIIDNYSFSRIEGVQIFLAPSYGIDTSNKKGKFKLNLSYNYLGTMKFVHPDYYPFYKKIAKGDNMHPQSIMLIPRKLLLDTVCQIAFKENKRIKALCFLVLVLVQALVFPDYCHGAEMALSVFRLAFSIFLCKFPQQCGAIGMGPLRYKTIGGIFLGQGVFLRSS